jgi:hypothetical protein
MSLRCRCSHPVAYSQTPWKCRLCEGSLSLARATLDDFIARARAKAIETRAARNGKDAPR